MDLGGTKIRAAIVNQEGKTVGQTVTVTTGAQNEREVVEGQLFHSIDEVLKKGGLGIDKVLGIGIGSPGPLDLKTGTILNAPNLPTLNGYPLKDRVNDRYSAPVFVDNDANCFVLGEAFFGSARNASVVVGLTLGTGLGCGIVMDRKVYHGTSGTAAEIWKTPYRGKTIEETLSGKGLHGMYRRRAGEAVNAKEIALRAARGEQAALETWEEFGDHLGNILAFIVNLLDPEVVVLGGSISKAFVYFERSMEACFRPNINPVPGAHVRVERSRQGDMGGILGAAALCF